PFLTPTQVGRVRTPRGKSSDQTRPAQAASTINGGVNEKDNSWDIDRRLSGAGNLPVTNDFICAGRLQLASMGSESTASRIRERGGPEPGRPVRGPHL